MKKVTIGEYGVVVDPVHVKSLITMEALDEEINKVVLQQVEVAKRKQESDMVVAPEEYIDYLNRCKESLNLPVHPTYVEVPEEDLSKVLRYEHVVKGLMGRIRELEKTVTVYGGPLGDSVDNILLDIYGDQFDIEDVKTVLMYRGLLGDERAEVLVNSDVELNPNDHNVYKQIIERLGD